MASKIGGRRTALTGAVSFALAVLLTLGVAQSPAAATRVRGGAARGTLDWPSYGNDLANTRYQNVDQVTPANVAHLRPAWVFHTGVLDPKASFEASPIVVNGTLYVSTGHDDVFALNAATGAETWAYHPEAAMRPLSRLPLCCGRVNRGVAVADGTVYLARLDAVLVALDARTGQPVWQTRVANYHQGFSMTMAPQAVAGLVIVGVAGGEYVSPGKVMAFDARTGRPVWTFNTTKPGPTWAGTSWRKGGAPVWTTPSVDPQRGLVYVTTGNAAPNLDGFVRAGTNLYTSSIVTLDLRTGQVRWAFQEVHHDLWDYDGPQPAVLFTLRRGGRQIPALGHCNKAGYYFILDRRTGQPLYPVTEVPVPSGPAWQHAWPTQPESAIESLTPHAVTFTPRGRTAVPEFTPPHKQAELIQPGPDGGCEYPPAAYSPRTKFVYYGARYLPGLLTGAKSPRNSGGKSPKSSPATSLGSSVTEPVPGVQYAGIYGATDTTTGKIAWKIDVPLLAKSGLLVAGDLVFFGENDGRFHAVDARTGAILWTFQGTSLPESGGSAAAPIAYVAAGQEFVVNAFGGNFLDNGFQYAPSGDALVAFALPPAGATGPRIVHATAPTAGNPGPSSR